MPLSKFVIKDSDGLKKSAGMSSQRRSGVETG